MRRTGAVITPTEQQRRDAAHQALVASIDALKADQAEIRAELKANSEMTATNVASTKEMVEIFGLAKGGFKVLGWIGTAVKWVGGLATACIGIYALVQAILHGGMPPK